MGFWSVFFLEDLRVSWFNPPLINNLLIRVSFFKRLLRDIILAIVPIITGLNGQTSVLKTKGTPVTIIADNSLIFLLERIGSFLINLINHKN